MIVAKYKDNNPGLHHLFDVDTLLLNTQPVTNVVLDESVYLCLG